MGTTLEELPSDIGKIKSWKGVCWSATLNSKSSSINFSVEIQDLTTHGKSPITAT